MVFFQLNVTGLLFQSFRTVSPDRAKGLLVIFSKQPNINRIPQAFIGIFNNEKPELNPIIYIVNNMN